MINLLELAMPIIHTVTEAMGGVFSFRSLTGEEKTRIGTKIPKYGKWNPVQGEVQPVQRSRYSDLGLDFSKNYINAWGSVVMNTVTEMKQPDQILWRGMLWTVTAVNEWNPQNGWVNVTAVQDKRYMGD